MGDWRLSCLSLVLALAACSSSPVGPPPTAVVTAAPLPAPEWRLRDRWVYQWTSGDKNGTKAIEVVDATTINSVPYFVLRLDAVDHYYTKELHWAAAIRESRVEARMVPPLPWFTWPLTVDGRWVHHGTFEDPTGKTVFNDHFSVIGLETIDVPAGRFQAMKVVRQGERRDSDEYWYAADVRWYVRWVGRRGEVAFEERLREYRPGPR